MKALARPSLIETPLGDVYPPRPGAHRCYVTIGPGEWDGTAEAAYNLGFVLLEFGPDGAVSRAYRKSATTETRRS